MERKAIPSATSDWVIRSTTPGSVERIEAWFGGHGYDPHRHDAFRRLILDGFTLVDAALASGFMIRAT